MKGQRLSTIAKILGSRIENENYIEHLNDKYVEHFEFDSRKLVQNSLFFALKGEKFDGHDFLREAAEKKAAGAVVSRDYQGNPFGLSLIRVDDVVGSLQDLAKETLSKRSLKIVGITGSVGKTTTKEFVATLLSARFRIGKIPGNRNTQVSFPTSILNHLNGEEEVFVAEMGISLPGEMANLVDIAPPDIVLINKIAFSHAEFFVDGIRGIAREKGEILSHFKTKHAIIHNQAFSFEEISKRVPRSTSTFGLDPSLDYCVHFVEEGIIIKEKNGFSTRVFTLPFQASHLCENFLGAAVVARNLGMEWEEIIKQSAHLKTYIHRFDKVEKKGITFIDDCYNANPESMKAALQNLPKPSQGGKTVAVLGAMKELGKYSEDFHREIGKCALDAVDHLLCFGKECLPMTDVFTKEGRPVDHFPDLSSLREKLQNVMQPGDVVLIKGSNSLQMWRLLED